MDMLPLYKRVRLEIEGLLSGMSVGCMIPTESELMQKFSISRVTIRKALQDLRNEGILESFKGKGTFLAKIQKKTAYDEKVTKILGVIMPTIESRNMARIFQGIENEASRLGFRVLLTYNGGDPLRQITLLKEISKQKVDGILLYPDGFVTENKNFLQLLSDLQQWKKKLVFLDRYVGGYSFPCVMTDNVKGMYQATEHVILQGYRKPALIGFWSNNTVHTDRRKGFLNALHDYKIPTSNILESEVGSKDFDKHAYEITTSWLKGEKKSEHAFDSIVCMTDAIAHGVFMALRNAGLRVPEDVVIIGYDNDDSALYQAMGLHLTSIQQPLEKIGEMAAATLIQMIAGKVANGNSNHKLLDPQLIIRTSCGEGLFPICNTVNDDDNHYRTSVTTQ